MGAKSLSRAKEVGGGLPEGSLYKRVEGLWEGRLGYSQRKETGTMETEVFAGRLVEVALRGEWGVLGRLVGVGRPDWWWCGGQAGTVWWGSWLGEWVFDWGVWRRFGLAELKEVVENERRAVEERKEKNE